MEGNQDPNRYLGKGSQHQQQARLVRAFLCPTLLRGGHLRPVPVRDRAGEGEDRVNIGQILTRITYKARAPKSNARVAGRVEVGL